MEDSRQAVLSRLPLFRTRLAFCAACSILVNLAFIHSSVGMIRFGASAYGKLSQNPKAYGRLVSAEAIESLRDPSLVWRANAAVILAAVVAMFIAIYLLWSLIRMSVAPAETVGRLRRYRRWKSLSAVATLIAATSAELVNHWFVTTATRHIAVGSWTPGVAPLLLFLGALIPLWWISKALVGCPEEG